MEKLTLTYLGTYHPWHGDLFYMSHPDGREARVTVDSIGETWVDVRRVPDGGVFHTERVESYRVFNGAAREAEALRVRGFDNLRHAIGAHNVKERGL